MKGISIRDGSWRFRWLFLGVCYLSTCLLCGAREVRMATVEWAPYYSRNLPSGGVISEIVQTAFSKVGDKTTLEFVPWGRALRSAENGDYEAVMGAYYSEGRDARFEFSDPIYEVEVGFIARKDLGITEYKDLRELTRYRFGIGLGWVSSPDFDAAHFLTKEAVTRPILNIRKMHWRRIDICVMSLKVFEYELEKSELKGELETVVLQPLLAKNPLYLIVPKDHPDAVRIIQDFNRGLQIIKSDGTYEKILRKHGF